MASTCRCEPWGSTSNAGATPPRSRAATPRIRIPKKYASGWRRPTPPSRSEPRKKWPRSTGAMRRARRRTDIPPSATRGRDSHMNLISTITNEGAVRFMTYKETMTAALFITFLSRFLRSTTGKIFLILDRLPAHVAGKVEAWVAARPERIELFYLPRYSPELNAVEYLNNDLKGGVNAAGLPHDKPELRTRIQEFMRKLLHLPKHVMSFFQHPCTQYAAGTQL